MENGQRFQGIQGKKIMANIIAIIIGVFKNPLLRSFLLGFLFVSSLFICFYAGRHKGYNQCFSQIKIDHKNWQERISTLQKEYSDKLSEITQEYQDKELLLQTALDTVDETKEEQEKNKPSPVITKYVRIYLPVQVDRPVPKGIIKLHNLSAKGLPLSKDNQTDAAEESKVPLSTVASTVAKNYYQYNIQRERMIALQRMVKDFQQKQHDLEVKRKIEEGKSK